MGHDARELLDPEVAAQLQALPYSYPEIGATRQPRLPDGYRTDQFSVLAGRGRRRYDEVAELVLNWRLQSRSGLRVQTDRPRVEPGAVAMATLSLGPLRIRTRCRVLYLLAEENRCGYAYGTLLGHPERGEEQFLVEIDQRENVRLRLRSFSRSDSLLARLGGPISRRVQLQVNRRYLEVVAEPGAVIEHRTGRAAA